MCDTTTYRRLRDDFDFNEPQTIHLKGKGNMAVYRLLGKKDALSAAATAGVAPNLRQAECIVSMVLMRVSPSGSRPRSKTRSCSFGRGASLLLQPEAHLAGIDSPPACSR